MANGLLLTQHITEPTGSKMRQKDLTLDFVISIEEGMLENLGLEEPLGKSDHSTIKGTLRRYKSVEESWQQIKTTLMI